MVKNPDVTVRERGVMEKCTFCVQRIREAEIDARGRGPAAARRRGEDRVPAGVSDERDRLRLAHRARLGDDAPARASRAPTACSTELGTEPRVRYLARIRNPNPALESGG